LVVTGWGKVENKANRTKKSVPDSEADYFGGSTLLREARVPVIPQASCKMNYKDHSGRSRPKSLISDESMFCAGHLSGGADTCKQDSGGPAVAEINGKATLVGITSWGDGCGRPNRPGVYTKVGNYVDWIQSNLRSDIGGTFLFSL